MPVLFRRAHVAAACAALSTVAVAGMVAVTVFAGGGTCDLAGCAPVVGAVATTPDRPGNPCVAPTSTARRSTPVSCPAPAPGGMATARVPAP